VKNPRPRAKTTPRRRTPAASAAPAASKVDFDQLTEPQVESYKILRAAKAPMSAYSLLAELESRRGRRVYPQTVYRILDALLEHGLIHKIESANAFLTCTHPDDPHSGIHLVCKQCGVAEEVVDPRVSKMLSEDAKTAHFKLQDQVVELRGICGRCQAA
jgi:Fur family zinc uptake transcriptional regulator